MAYYLDSDDRILLNRLLHTNVCAECGSELEAYYDIDRHLPYLQCPTSGGHEGIGKPNKKQENSYKGGLREMAQVERQHGIDKARQLERYQGVTSLTRPQAMEIMETIWPDAPQADKMAAAILCSSYGLNPLANHVFLVPFKDKEGHKTWARVWGIKAKRLLASRRGGYSYLDMTPRLMTTEEQIKVWGSVDTANLCYMTWLKDMKTGAEVYGYGKWPLKVRAWDYNTRQNVENDNEPRGTDKGNSMANMASIRSESQAIDRLRPAEMPSGFAVIDEQYIEGEGRIVDTETGKITEDKVEAVQSGNAQAEQISCDRREELKTIVGKSVVPSVSQQLPQDVTGQQGKPEEDKEVEDIVQQLEDKKWTGATLGSLLTKFFKIPPAELSGLSQKEVVSKLNHDQREALCKKLIEQKE